MRDRQSETKKAARLRLRFACVGKWPTLGRVRSTKIPPQSPPSPELLNDLATDLERARQDAHANVAAAREQFSDAATNLLKDPALPLRPKVPKP